MKVYEVVFKENGKQYKFCSEEAHEIGDNVIVETERGLQFAYIVEEKKNANFSNLKEIVRKATEKDVEKYFKNKESAIKALSKAKTLAEEKGLKMQFVDAEYTFDKSQLVLTFTAENRVDFRTLAKDLALIYKTRIEFRQIGIRDKAREINGTGVCGRPLCCASFLKNLCPVSISMVKNQNLSLIPSKINGQCGRLLCCLTYEDDNYSECRQGLPKAGDVLDTDIGRATVTYVDILNRSFTVQNDKEERLTIKKDCDGCGKNNK